MRICIDLDTTSPGHGISKEDTDKLRELMTAWRKEGSEQMGLTIEAELSLSRGIRERHKEFTQRREQQRKLQEATR